MQNLELKANGFAKKLNIDVKNEVKVIF